MRSRVEPASLKRCYATVGSQGPTAENKQRSVKKAQTVEGGWLWTSLCEGRGRDPRVQRVQGTEYRVQSEGYTVQSMSLCHCVQVCTYLGEYTKALIASADNVGSKQFQDIRAGLRPDSVVLMGKNTMIKRSIREYAKSTGDESWNPLLDLLVVSAPSSLLYNANVILYFTVRQ